MEKRRAQEILDNFGGRRVLVIGDVMLDEYVWGKVSRISPEAPVMVVDADRETHVPGGAANVVNNLCALGAVASIAGVIGDDAAGAILAKAARGGAQTEGLLVAPSRPTTRKTRIIAHSQQVVRVDHERRDPISADIHGSVLAFLGAAIPVCDAVLLSDYQKGLLGRDLVAAATDLARAHGKVVTGNLKPQGIGPHCRLSVITLNLSEASAATGFILNDASSAGQLRDAGRVLLRKSGAEHILITRGAQGLTLFSADGGEASVPAHPVAVYDVAGAGDSVISTLTLALAAGATPPEAVLLANCAGAVVVRKVGVATATRLEILATVTPEDE